MQPSIYHAWSGSKGDVETDRRVSMAQQTRETESAQYGGTYLLMDLSQRDFKRTGKDVGDPAPLPFIHDMADAAFDTVIENDSDICVITNADICLYRGFSDEVADVCGKHGSCYAYRWDFSSVSGPISTKAEIKKGRWYIGSDAFAFTRKWWNDHRDELPPFILGRETWDWILRELIKETGGQELHAAIYHESHRSPWKKGRLYQPGNVYNRSYARAWLRHRKMHLREIANAPYDEVSWPLVKWAKKEGAPVISGVTTDVLIVLGRGSKWSNTELRYCLRSIEKHANGLGRVFVVGNNPGFLSKECITLWRDDAGKNKEHNIAEQVMHACKSLPLSEDFLWTTDDVFFLQDTDITKYPYYHDGDLEQKWNRCKPGGYRVALMQTDAQLRGKSLPTSNHEIHVPLMYNRTKFRSLEKWLDLSSRVPMGLTFRSVYCNVLGVTPGPRYTDMKIGNATTAAELKAKTSGRHCFSIGDGLLDDAKGFLHELFPNPSKYEAS